MTEIQSLRNLIEVLAKHEVNFIVIGGVAMRLHGSAHVTEDLDVMYARDPDNLVRLAEALKSYGPRLRGAPEDLPFRWDARTLKAGANFTLDTSIGWIDLLSQVSGVDSFDSLGCPPARPPAGAQIRKRSIEMDLDGFTVKVASIDDIVAMKKAANRAKDKNHLLELEVLRGLLSGEDS
jgi:hypothetical protein